jgi:hypothetical protein
VAVLLGLLFVGSSPRSSAPPIRLGGRTSKNSSPLTCNEGSLLASSRAVHPHLDNFHMPGGYFWGELLRPP